MFTTNVQGFFFILLYFKGTANKNFWCCCHKETDGDEVDGKYQG